MRQRPVMPRAIEQPDPGHLRIVWSDGRTDAYTARQLRLACPCAHCVHEITRQPLLDPASVAAAVTINDQQRVGNYALRFLFSDGHSTGIYAWPLLRGLGGS